MRRFLIVVAALITAVSATAFSYAWPTDHGNGRRTGWLPTQARFRHLATAFHVNLDGAVYGSPIVVGSLLLVATENNTVYALDAASGQRRWARHLATPVRLSSLPCGNIDPLGITGTPVFDFGTNRVFVMTESPDARTVARHDIWGLDVVTGRVGMHRRIEVPHTDPKAEQQRGALATDGHGNIFVPFGGLAGDCGFYRGAVVSLKANGALGARAYVVPTAREAGIWAAGGPVVANGTVYVAIGNGASVGGRYDGSDSVTRLTWDMRRIDLFAPSTWAADNAADADLGSMTPAYVSNGFILQAGKSGTGYVLRAGRLGGIGGQVYQAPLCAAFGVAASTSNTVYLPCTGGLTRVEVTSGGRFIKRWTQPAVNGSPVVGNGAIFSASGSTLYAVSATGRVIASVNVGAVTRFATPALGPHYTYVGTTSGVVGVHIG